MIRGLSEAIRGAHLERAGTSSGAIRDAHLERADSQLHVALLNPPDALRQCRDRPRLTDRLLDVDRPEAETAPDLLDRRRRGRAIAQIGELAQIRLRDATKIVPVGKRAP
jgi:hypothetical protein